MEDLWEGEGEGTVMLVWQRKVGMVARWEGVLIWYGGRNMPMERWMRIEKSYQCLESYKEQLGVRR